ncbi:MAG: hypothetical protein WDO72_12530 [Pseudomonadota bacterium]
MRFDERMQIEQARDVRIHRALELRMTLSKFLEAAFLVSCVVHKYGPIVVGANDFAHTFDAFERGILAGQIEEVVMFEYALPVFDVARPLKRNLFVRSDS